MKITKISIILLVALAPWLSAAQIVTNGSFDGVVTSEPRSYLGNAADAPPGWTATRGLYGGVEQWNTGTPPARGNPGYNSLDAWAPMGSSSDGGLYMVFRSAYFGVFQPSTLSQGITGLLPNTTYAVQFEMANMTVGSTGEFGGDNTQIAIGQDGHFDVSMSGTLEGTLSTLVLSNPAQTDIDLSVMGAWTPVTLFFTTSSSVTSTDVLNLQFSHMYDGNPDPGALYGQLALDGVSVTQVPEPSSMALLTMTMGVAVLHRRRRSF